MSAAPASHKEEAWFCPCGCQGYCKTYSRDMLKLAFLASNSSAAPCSRLRMSSAVRLSQLGSAGLCFRAVAFGAADCCSCFAHFRTLSECTAAVLSGPRPAGLVALPALSALAGFRGASDWTLRFAGCAALLAVDLRFEPSLGASCFSSLAPALRVVVSSTLLLKLLCGGVHACSKIAGTTFSHCDATTDALDLHSSTLKQAFLWKKVQGGFTGRI